jgi:hypothetical protein
MGAIPYGNSWLDMLKLVQRVVQFLASKGDLIMTATELLITTSAMLGLAVLRFGVPALITWLIGKTLKLAAPHHPERF